MGIRDRHGSPNDRSRAGRVGVVVGLAVAAVVVLTTLGDAMGDPAVDTSVAGVSCWSAQGCVAVGNDSVNASHALAWELAGSAWHLASTNPPPIGGGVQLAGVSCPAASTCIAVGYADQAPFSLQLTGSAWTSVYPPVSSSVIVVLTGVSCPTAGWCLAIAAGVTTGFYEFDGSAWRTAAGPSDSGVVSVSCASPRFCVAIGDQTAEKFNGSAWKPVPLPTLGRERLDSVSCPAAGACVAVGSEPSPTIFGGAAKQVLLRYRAGRFSIMTARVPAGAAPVSVSCTAPGACVAVGSLAQRGPFAERLSHGTWSPLPTINPNPDAGTLTTTPAFTSVSCLPGGRCIAVGDGTSPFSEILGPGGPTLLPMPVP